MCSSPDNKKRDFAHCHICFGCFCNTHLQDHLLKEFFLFLLELSQKLLLDGFMMPSFVNEIKYSLIGNNRMFCAILDQVNKYVVFRKFCYNYNIVGRIAMIFLNEFNVK